MHGYGLDESGVGDGVPVGGKYFSSPQRPDLLWGHIQLPIHWVTGLFPQGIKRSKREADHSPPSSAEVKET
jgi:hypothetical protein